MEKQIKNPKVLENIKRIRIINTYMIDIINFISNEVEENTPIQLQKINNKMYCKMIDNTHMMTKKIENMLLEIDEIHDIKDNDLENGRRE